MIELCTNRDQFLTTLEQYVKHHVEPDSHKVFESKTTENGARVYANSQYALSIFRPNETWTLHVKHEDDISTVRVAVHYPDFTACFKISLRDDFETSSYVNNNIFDSLTVVLEDYPQVDWYDEVLASSLFSYIHERNGLPHISVPVKKLKYDKQTNVSLLFHGSESSKLDKVVLIFNVTNNEGRDDTYAVTVLNKSETLNYLMGLYKRAVFSRFLHEALDEKNVNREIISVRYVEHGWAVCVRRPLAFDGHTYDQNLDIGTAYRVTDENTGMNGTDYIKIEVPKRRVAYTRASFYSNNNVLQSFDEKEYALHNFYYFR